MSATGRGAQRAPYDFYPTPSWCVERLVERVPLPGGDWLEPAAGDGAIIKAVARQDITWTAVDVRASCRPHLQALVPTVHIHDFLTLTSLPRFRIAITNPPYSLAEPFVRRLLPLCEQVVMLVRLNWLASARRAGLFATRMPDVFVLPNRPSFDGEGTDATDYGWLSWPGDVARRRGSVEVLATTPRAVRLARTSSQRAAAISSGSSAALHGQRS